MVGGHRPIYSDDIVGVLQQTFEDLMLKYKVDIFFAGHRHYATRSWPLQANGTITAKNYVNPKGVVHITAGGIRHELLDKAHTFSEAELQNIEGSYRLSEEIAHQGIATATPTFSQRLQTFGYSLLSPDTTPNQNLFDRE